MMTLIERAKRLAHLAHFGKVDKAGRPYIEHVARVASAVADDPQAEAVAWAHDVVEDYGFPSNWDDYPRDFRESVVRLTRHPDDPPSEYYKRIRSDPIALRVKLADVADNADESRLAMLDEKTASRLREKYARAMRELRPNA